MLTILTSPCQRIADLSLDNFGMSLSMKYDEKMTVERKIFSIFNRKIFFSFKFYYISNLLFHFAAYISPHMACRISITLTWLNSFMFNSIYWCFSYRVSDVQSFSLSCRIVS